MISILKKSMYIFRRGLDLGYCPVCEKKTIFYKGGDWLREHHKCIRCKSIPRNRALMHVLQEFFPNWRELKIQESSPSSPTFEKFKLECPFYTPTHFFPNKSPGSLQDGFRCEDLARQTFNDDCFDLVITQDVIEHLFEPQKALREINRTLKPGGAHVFTVPWHHNRKTTTRAKKDKNEVIHVKQPEYHGNPIDASGSLVVTDWGKDICDIIFQCCGMTTAVLPIENKLLGIQGKNIHVFISKKPSDPASDAISNHSEKTPPTEKNNQSNCSRSR